MPQRLKALSLVLLIAIILAGIQALLPSQGRPLSERPPQLIQADLSFSVGTAFREISEASPILLSAATPLLKEALKQYETLPPESLPLDAQLKIVALHIELGNKASARRFLRRVISHPQPAKEIISLEMALFEKDKEAAEFCASRFLKKPLNWSKLLLLREISGITGDKELFERADFLLQQKADKVFSRMIPLPLVMLLSGLGGLVILIFFGVRRILLRHREFPPLAYATPASWRVSQAVILAVTWMVMQVIAGVLVIAPLRAAPLAVQLSASYVLAALLTWLLAKRFIFQGHPRLSAQMGLRMPLGGKELLWGLAGFAALQPLMYLGQIITSSVVEIDPFTANPAVSIAFESTSLPERICIIFMIALIGPILEELIFRGVLYRALRNLWNPTLAILLASFFFAAIHPLPTILPVFLLGVVLAYLYEWSGSLVPGMVAHGLHNGLLVATLFVLHSVISP